MTRLFFKLRYYPNLREDRFLIIFYFHRMKLEKIFSCTHKVWFFLPNFPLEGVHFVVSCVACLCPVDINVPWLCSQTIMEREGCPGSIRPLSSSSIAVPQKAAEVLDTSVSFLPFPH